MSVSLALAAGASAQAAAANAAAQAAQRTSCMSFVQGFDAKTATVAMAQQYSSCISLLYPTAGADMPRWIVGLLVVWFLAWGFGGFWQGRKDSYADGFADRLFHVIFGLTAGLIVGGLLLAFGAGVYYAFF